MAETSLPPHGGGAEDDTSYRKARATGASRAGAQDSGAVGLGRSWARRPACHRPPRGSDLASTLYCVLAAVTGWAGWRDVRGREQMWSWSWQDRALSWA